MGASYSNSVVTALRRNGHLSLTGFLRDRRWFAGKARVIQATEILDVVPLETAALRSYFVLAKIAYSSGPSEIYDIPLTLADDSVEGSSAETVPRLNVRAPDSTGSDSNRDLGFEDALSDERFLDMLLGAIASNRAFPGLNGVVEAVAGKSFAELRGPAGIHLPPVLNRGEQSNSSVMYGKRLILKLFRRLGEGVNPDIEIGSFLTDKTSFRNIAPVAGDLRYTSKQGRTMSLGILQGFIANEGDAWEFTLKQLAGYYERVSSASAFSDPSSNESAGPAIQHSVLEFAQEEIPPAARETIGEYIGWAELLGQRTAELHLALSSDTADTNFRPELFNEVHQAEFVESAEQLLSSTFKTLQEQWKGLPLDLREQAKRILGDEAELRKRLLAFKFHPISAMRTRIHGDYHLGQVLFTGNDFVIIDFEGEPSRSLAERRKKRSPLQDVAGMLRSFHYAAYAPLVRPQTASGDAARLNAQRTWASYWQRWVSVGFLRRYCEVAGKARFIPTTQGEFAVMLDFYLLDKAIYELSYELNNRPTWVRTPLEGIAQILGRVA